jgi:lysophospholipase L1-like esterase
MNPKYTNDGLHLLGDGYLLWAEIIKPLLSAKK